MKSLMRDRPEEPGFESLLWPRTEPRVGPYIPRQGGADTPFFRVRPRLTRLESLAQLMQRGGDSNLELPDSRDLSSEPVWPQTAAWPLAMVQKKAWTSWGKIGLGWGVVCIR